MNILIADDHQVVRFGTHLLLKESWPETYIHEAESFPQVLKMLSEYPVDLLLLDINIPGGNDLRMIDRVKLRQADVKILIFSAYDEQLYAERYLRAGANGYLQKDASDQEIRKGIGTVLNEGYYLSPAMRNNLMSQIAGHKKQVNGDSLGMLSDREIEVANLLVKGSGIVEVAKKLNLQVTTVSTYKNRIFKKLEISNLVELVEQFRFHEQAGYPPAGSP